MMKLLNIFSFIFFVVFLLPTFLKAEDLSLHTQITSKKSQLGLAYETSSFTADEGTIVGSGGRIHFFHSFNSSYSGQVYLSAALNQQGDVQSSFTGLGATVFYNLWGDTTTRQREISLSGNLIASETVEQTQCVLFGGGISQYFFNGNEGVYSASGFNVTLAYQITVYKIRWEALARYNLLGAGSTSLTGTNLSLGLSIPL